MKKCLVCIANGVFYLLVNNLSEIQVKILKIFLVFSIFSIIKFTFMDKDDIMYKQYFVEK